MFGLLFPSAVVDTRKLFIDEWFVCLSVDDASTGSRNQNKCSEHSELNLINMIKALNYSMGFCSLVVFILPTYYCLSTKDIS